MIFWHKLTTCEKKEVLDSEITIGDFRKKYKAPDWCREPSAMDGGFLGCWSLMSPRKIKKPSHCAGCFANKKLVGMMHTLWYILKIWRKDKKIAERVWRYYWHG